MRLTFKRDGGESYLPGLNRPVTIDTAALPADEASKVESLVSSANFFNQPAVVGSPKRGAVGYFTYNITVEDNDRSHTVQLNDFTHDKDLLALRDYLQSKKAG